MAESAKFFANLAVLTAFLLWPAIGLAIYCVFYWLEELYVDWRADRVGVVFRIAK